MEPARGSTARLAGPGGGPAVQTIVPVPARPRQGRGGNFWGKWDRRGRGAHALGPRLQGRGARRRRPGFSGVKKPCPRAHPPPPGAWPESCPRPCTGPRIL